MPAFCPGYIAVGQEGRDCGGSIIFKDRIRHVEYRPVDIPVHKGSKEETRENRLVIKDTGRDFGHVSMRRGP
jgi:hypothetical protein